MGLFSRTRIHRLNPLLGPLAAPTSLHLSLPCLDLSPDTSPVRPPRVSGTSCTLGHDGVAPDSLDPYVMCRLWRGTRPGTLPDGLRGRRVGPSPLSRQSPDVPVVTSAFTTVDLQTGPTPTGLAHPL